MKFTSDEPWHLVPTAKHESPQGVVSPGSQPTENRKSLEDMIDDEIKNLGDDRVDIPQESFVKLNDDYPFTGLMETDIPDEDVDLNNLSENRPQNNDPVPHSASAMSISPAVITAEKTPVSTVSYRNDSGENSITRLLKSISLSGGDFSLFNGIKIVIFVFLAICALKALRIVLGYNDSDVRRKISGDDDSFVDRLVDNFFSVVSKIDFTWLIAICILVYSIPKLRRALSI